MAHYAFLNDNNIVTEVIVGKDETDTTHDWEKFYGEIRNQTCKRTSYNTHANNNLEKGSKKEPFRKNYAGVGYIYDELRDAFYEPQPFTSWTLDEDTCIWKSPIEYPSDAGEKMYYWDEDVYQADNTKGWVTDE